MDDVFDLVPRAGKRAHAPTAPDDAPARLTLLGAFRLTVEGEERRVPSRKARLMLARLALADGAAVSREALTALFWEDRAPEQARSSLRTALAELRRCLAPHAELLRGGEGAVSLDVDRVAVDALDLVALASGPDAARALPLLGGDLLQNEPGAGLEAEHWLETERRRLRHLALHVLDAAVDRAAEEREHARAAELALRALALEPLREGLHRKLMAAYERMGEPTRALRQFRLLQELLRAELDVAPEPETLALYHRIRAGRRAPPAGAPARLAPAARAGPVGQVVRFCRAGDGVRLAYATSGQGAALVKAANWMTHLDHERDSPVWRHWIAALSERFRLHRYDQRANGLSDWDVADLSFDAMVSDLGAVVDAAGLERFVLLGISQGCAISVAYAARHPERVRGLILYGGYARGWRARGDPHEVARRGALGTLIREGWGQDAPVFRQVFTSLFIPGASPEQMGWFNKLQRISVSPENAARLSDLFGDIDVSGLLGELRTPTLVLHARGDLVCPFAEGRQLAAAIPGARLVTLESANHILLQHEPDFERVMDEITAFVDTLDAA